ncbi:hypothetical protein LUZ60_002656 [Juncus effusus]|nr:hypothetical protein LUZ60_002656 [Juncus effusus]
MEEEQTSYQSVNKKGSCFDWQLEGYEKEMFMSGYVLSHKPIPDLLQNCDLPPPLKIFSPIADHEENFSKFDSLSPNTPLFSRNSTAELQQLSSKELEFPQDKGGDYNTNLLRALHLSQTRAREAEKEFAKTSTQNQQITVLFLEESLRLSAHKNWVRLLETENSILRKKKKMNEEETTEDDDVAVAADVATWYLTLALCLGIAGVGFALGKCLF